MFPAFLIIVFFFTIIAISLKKKPFFSFYFADGPTFLYHPRTTSGDRLETITLHCIVDSNPPPQYYWTKGSSREVRAFSAGWGTRTGRCFQISDFGSAIEKLVWRWIEPGIVFHFWVYGDLPSIPDITILDTWSVSSVKVTKIELERFGLNVLLMT